MKTYLASLDGIDDWDGCFTELNKCLVDADVDCLWHGGSQGLDIKKRALYVGLDFDIKVLEKLVNLTCCLWCQLVRLG